MIRMCHLFPVPIDSLIEGLAVAGTQGLAV